MLPSVPQQPDLHDKLKVNPFIDGPTESLVKSAAGLIAAVPEWRFIFGENIDVYERFDYSYRALPALRVYNESYRKEHESHYITGELNLDIVYPASLRREELQRFQDVLTAAMLQQFRRPEFFASVLERVPGLNELGKVFDVDKTLGLRLEEGFVPLTRMRANFRIDLKQWDSYLEMQGRTKDDPFNVTLGDLRLIAAKILPKRDDGTPDQPAAVDLAIKTGGT